MSILRGQAAFEYLLIIGGSVLVAAVAMMVVQGSAGEANNSITRQTHSFVGFIENLSEIPTAASTSTPTATISNPLSCDPACDTSCKFCSSGGVCVYYAGYNCCGSTDCPSGYTCTNHLCTSPSGTVLPSPTPSPSPSAAPSVSPSPSPTPTPSVSPTPTPQYVGGDQKCFSISAPGYYILQDEVVLTSGTNCITFSRFGSNSELNCNSKKISRSPSVVITGTSGVYMGAGVTNVTLRNCAIESFDYGIKTSSAYSINLRRLDLSNNNYGIHVTDPQDILITGVVATHNTMATSGFLVTSASGGQNTRVTMFDNYVDHATSAMNVNGIAGVNITKAELADDTYNVDVSSSSSVNISGITTYRAYYGISISNINGAGVTNNYLSRTGPAALCDISATSVTKLGIQGNTVPNFFLCLDRVSNATLSSNNGSAGYLRFTDVNSSVVWGSSNDQCSLFCSSCFFNVFNNMNVNANTSRSSWKSRVFLWFSNNNTVNNASLSGANVGAYLYASSNNTFNALSTSGNGVIGVYAWGGAGNVFSASTISDGATVASNSTFSGSTIIGRNFTVRPVWIDTGCGSCIYWPVAVALQSSTVSSQGTVVGTVSVSLSSSTIAGVKNYTMPWVVYPGYSSACNGPYGPCWSWCNAVTVWYNLSATITGTGAGTITKSYAVSPNVPYFPGCGRDLDVPYS